MGWTPREVRGASLADINAAYSGFLRARGINPKQPAPQRPTRAWLENHKRRVAETRARIEAKSA